MASNTAAKPPRPYRDFLTPFLHRQFTHAAVLSLGICYLEAVWMSWSNPFWSWFPISTTGVRTILIFISSLAVFILRVAQLHVGGRTTASGFKALQQIAGSFKAVQTLFWYSFSAWFFSEIYMWSAPSSSNLGVIDPGRTYERQKLNERSIYLRTMFLFLAVPQSIVHLYYDYDGIQLEPVDVSRTSLPSSQDFFTTASKLGGQAIQIANVASFRICTSFVIGTAVYFLSLRSYVWAWTYSIANKLFSLPRTSAPGFAPPGFAGLIGRFLTEGLLLILLWEVTNRAFSLFVSIDPLKKGQPLSSDSKDPTGTLLAGLRARKEIPRAFAFSELLLITYHFPARRACFYKELDRQNGSSWTQLLTICLGELQATAKRIQDFQTPKTVPPTTESHYAASGLPKIAGPMKQEGILNKPAPPNSRTRALEDKIGVVAKSYGQNPGAQNPISPQARKLLKYGADNVLSKEQQGVISDSGIEKRLYFGLLKVLQNQIIGKYFRQTFRRRAAAIVLGQPHGNPQVVVAATYSVTKVAVCSLTEDPYGSIQRDVPNLIRTFTSSCSTLQGFLKTLSPHWTDVEFQTEATNARAVPEISVVHRALCESLQQLLTHFAQYADDLGLSMTDIRLAREAIEQQNTV